MHAYCCTQYVFTFFHFNFYIGGQEVIFIHVCYSHILIRNITHLKIGSFGSIDCTSCLYTFVQFHFIDFRVRKKKRWFCAEYFLKFYSQNIKSVVNLKLINLNKYKLKNANRTQTRFKSFAIYYHCAGITIKRYKI